MTYMADRMLERLYQLLWSSATSEMRQFVPECEKRSGALRFEWIRFEFKIDDPHIEYLLNRLTEVHRTRYWYIALPGRDPYHGYEIFDNRWLLYNSDDNFRPSTLEQLKYRWDHPQPPKTTPSTYGFVYLFKAGEYYKIGASINPDVRKMQLQIQLPFAIERVHWFECNDYLMAESILHSEFRQKKVNGEWFTLSPEDVKRIKSIKHGDELRRIIPPTARPNGDG
jgi:hypothetical protein